MIIASPGEIKIYFNVTTHINMFIHTFFPDLYARMFTLTSTVVNTLLYCNNNLRITRNLDKQHSSHKLPMHTQ